MRGRNYTININVDGVQLNQTTHGKSLGLNIDDLSWKAHIHDISKKKSPQEFVRLSESGHLLPCTLQLKYTKILLYIDYCSADWDRLSQKLSDKLQKLQNRAVRVIT